MKYKLLVFDGAMGTSLQQEGLKPGSCPELMNIESPEIVKKIHKAYLRAGADVLTTNTFGASSVKLKEYGLDDRVSEINKKGVLLAKEIAAKQGNSYVAASVGPLGQFVEPIGKLSFDEAYEIFKKQISALASEKPDFILLETFSDLGELRAALLASQDVSKIPVICSLTFEGRRTLTGVNPASAAVILESMGAYAVGANCSGGPKELYEVVKEIAQNTKLPVIVQPNAGLPQIKDGKIIYPLGSQEFIEAMEPYFELGINIFGSCCGSTPDHTRELKNRLTKVKNFKRKVNSGSFLASREKVVRIGEEYLPKIIGERINPTARKKLAESLKKEDWGYIQAEAERQIEKGAHLLDVNVGTPGINEVFTMKKLINLLQQNITVPLVIDSTNPEVIEESLKAYQGKALVNSVNGEKESLDKILPLVKRYGSGVIALTLDEKGIPKTAEKRVKIAQRIVDKCLQIGIPKKDIYVDCLVLTVGTDDRAPQETLKAIKLIKEKLGVNTVLGISNVSHGLPNRSKLNSAFLAMAILNGLDLAIINPLDDRMIDAWQSASLLAGRDTRAQNYLDFNREEKLLVDTNLQAIKLEEPSFDLISNLVVKGSFSIDKVVKKLLAEGREPLEIINKGLIPGLNTVGKLYEEGKYYLPQLMLSAETAQNAFKLLENKLSRERSLDKGTIVIGTVKGDVHDIGKNMVAVMLKNHGFKVIDLGKNVPREKFLEVLVKEKAQFLALSALMTSTMIEIPPTIDYIKENKPDTKVIVGGAVVTEEFAKEAGADGYGKDAINAVKIVEELRRI